MNKIIKITFFTLFILISCSQKKNNQIEFIKTVKINFMSLDSLDLLKNEIIYKNYNLLNAKLKIENKEISLFLIDSNNNNIFNDSTDILFISPSCHELPKNINFNNKLGLKKSRLFSNNGFAFSIENIEKAKNGYKAEFHKLDSTYIIPNENKMLDKLPNLNFKNIDGSTMNFNEFKNKNKLIYVEFWATWCSPCIAMIPEIKQLHSEYYNELEIITIHSQRSVDIKKIKNNIDKHQMNWTNGISTIEINNNFNFGAYPKGFLFEQEGNLLIYDATPILIKEYIKVLKNKVKKSN